MHKVTDGGEGPQTARHDHASDTAGPPATLNPSVGFFWDGPPPDEPPMTAAQAALSDSYGDKKELITLAKTFIGALKEEAERVNPVKLDGAITEDEWRSARASQRAIVDQWFYEDVGCFIAPGGTGKTTLLLFQVIHIVLDRPLFGYEICAPGAVVILTAEDSRETLVARLRAMCAQLGLTEQEVRRVREDVIITDVSGKGIKLTTVEKDVVMPSAQAVPHRHACGH